MGAKLWIGFQSKQTVDSGVGKLIKELGGRGKDGDTTDGSPEAVIRPSETSVVTAPHPLTDVSGWTNQDVKNGSHRSDWHKFAKKTFQNSMDKH